jgi:nucleoid DNA-binding protein
MAAKKKKTTRKPAAKKTTRKPAAKKATAKAAKKATSKATATVAAAAARRPAREMSVRTTGFEKTSKTRSKSQVVKELAESTGLNKKEISNFFENLEALMAHDLTKGPGVFQVPGLLKVQVVRKKAVPARKGVNPFTGEEMMFKAKPARNVVRARPLKGLKDIVEGKRK